ncbi:MAG: hypothetical protein R3E66_00380 [bacterium]
MEINGERIEATRRCAECHAVSKQGFTEWERRTKEAVSAGIDLLSNPDELTQEDALRIVNYMRKGDDKSVFAAAKIGVFAAGAQFRLLHEAVPKAYGNDWGISTDRSFSASACPKGSHPRCRQKNLPPSRWFVEDTAAHMKDLVYRDASALDVCEETVALQRHQPLRHGSPPHR